MTNIVEMDAILIRGENGSPAEPDWPEADVIVGNPPFLGDKRMRSELGHSYVENTLSRTLGLLKGCSDDSAD
jgi:methylase of polypeptide subunit release factors